MDDLIVKITQFKEQWGELAILLLMLVGFIFVIIALISYFRVRRLVTYGKTTRGKVLKLEPVLRTDKGRRKRASSLSQIRFYTDTGKSVIFEATLPDDGTQGSGYILGSDVAVRYDPGNPSYARIDEDDRMWLAALTFGAFGGIFLFAGLMVAYNNKWSPEVSLDSLKARIANIFSPPNPVPVEMFPDFVAIAPLPVWWNDVRVNDKVIHTYDELQAVWESGTYVGSKLKASARRMFKVGYLTILYNRENDALVAEAIVRMEVIKMYGQYPQFTRVQEFALERYFYHNKPLARCVNCMHGDSIAYITQSLASSYNSKHRYDDTIKIIDNLISKRGHEISGYIQASLYENYAFALWHRGDREQAIDTLKMALGKWRDTNQGIYLQRDLDRYSNEFINQ